MQAAPARYVSVSELYSTDEVELLLDEIRELEPTSCRGEDVQDFEIAGSGCGGGAGGRSPAGTELTERSWDSHAQYLREPPQPPQPLAPLYCHLRYLLTLQGFATCLIVACSAGAGGCVWGGGWRGAGRPLALAALTSALLHAALLALRVSRLHRLLPLPWAAIGAACCAWAACSLAVGATLLLPGALRAAPPAAPAPALAAVGLAYAGAAAAAAAVTAAVARRRRGGPAARGAYRAVPGAAPACAASSSRDAPL